MMMTEIDPAAPRTKRNFAIYDDLYARVETRVQQLNAQAAGRWDFTTYMNWVIRQDLAAAGIESRPAAVAPSKRNRSAPRKAVA